MKSAQKSTQKSAHKPLRHNLFSWRRLLALCRKESFQIMRDPSSILIAFIMPILLLFVFGYAINLDADQVRLGLLMQDNGPAALRFEQALANSKGFQLFYGQSQAELINQMAHGEIGGIVVVQNNFSQKFIAGQGQAAIQILADGSEPNTANFIAAYVQGVWEKWLQANAQDTLRKPQAALKLETRTWYNPSAISRNFLVPGSIGVVMTIIGALLTSLVVAREWERGTMEALLATPVTRIELLLSKILPYYVLGMFAMLLCLCVAVFVMGVPFRGSLLALCGIATLFLGSAMGQGLYISTTTRNQFHAAQGALAAAFLPALMLSGFIFEIRSMPLILQWITHFIPARYLTSSLQTLFQAGTIAPVLWVNAFFLALLTTFWLGLTALKTKRTLD